MWRRRPGRVAPGAERVAAARRRSGSPDEDRWWDPADQARAESTLIDRRALGRGWADAPMFNNAEQMDPLGDDPASDAVRTVRVARRLTALDEGRAWRRREDGALLVLRTEWFATADDGAHRAAWQDHGEASLDATWRRRWRERDVVPGWIEARFVGVGERTGPLHAFAEAPPGPGASGHVDWIRIEDHTDPGGAGSVTTYEHLTVWAGRAHVQLTLRHDLATSEEAVAVAAERAYEVLASMDGA